MPKLDILFIFSRVFEFTLGQGTSWRQACVVAQPNDVAKARPDMAGWASVSTGYYVFFSSSMHAILTADIFRDYLPCFYVRRIK